MLPVYDCLTRYSVKVRPSPDTLNSTNLVMLAGTRFQVSEIVPDRLDPNNPAKRWGHICGGQYDGMYTALEYPNNPVPISSYTAINVLPPDEPPIPISEFSRRDVGIKIPDDGNRYVMAQHEIKLFGTTRHSSNKPTDRGPRPAVCNASWGIKTLATKTGDYYPIADPQQRWFYRFWDWASGYRLPVGEFEGTYINPKNPNIVYSKYTKGSKLDLYAGMIMDAKSHTDAKSPETGGRDVVTGRNLSSKSPWMWLCRPTTGALLKVIGSFGSKWKIECLDIDASLPDPETLSICQYYFGTQVDIRGNVTRYPDVKNAFEKNGYEPAGTAMPLVAPGGYFYINKRACVDMKPGQVWKPYYP